MLTNDQFDRWDRAHFFHPSTHLAQHARGESPTRIVTGAPSPCSAEKPCATNVAAEYRIAGPIACRQRWPGRTLRDCK